MSPYIDKCLHILTNVSFGTKLPLIAKGRVESQRLVFSVLGYTGHLIYPHSPYTHFTSQETGSERLSDLPVATQPMHWKARFETSWPCRRKALSIPPHQLSGDELGSFICLPNND